MTDAILPRAILSAWWREGSTRAVVLALTVLAALDSGYTSIWIGQRGLAGEVNPLIRSLFEIGLGPVWLVGNVIVTFLGAAFLGSCVVLMADQPRTYPIVGMSLLAALKVVLGLYHLIQFYGIIEFTWILWITALVAFLMTRELLENGRLVDWRLAARSIRELRSDLSTFIVFSRAPKTKPSLQAETEPIRVAPAKTSDHPSVLRNWKLFFWIGVIILAPILALSIVQLILQASGVLDLPRWMRGLGIVSEEQGRLFLVALATVILTIAVLIYGIVAVFEIFSSEPTRRRRGSQRRDNRNSMKRVAVCLVMLALVLTNTPKAFAMSQGLQLTSTIFPASGATEIAAIADSKGRIHAAWVENSNGLAGSGDVSLWYSVYDPESTTARTARLVGDYARVYSLDMTIDVSDIVHIVWVGESLGDTGAAGQSGMTERQPMLKEVWYQTIDSGETFSPSPILLLSFRADSATASVTLRNKSQLYFAWSEVLREDSSKVLSALYYGTLVVNDGMLNLTRVLVARITGASRMLKVVTALGQNSLHFAWVQELSAVSSQIMYSSVVLPQNIVRTQAVGNVSGTVGKLTLAATLSDDVVIGWVYDDSAQNGSTVYVARLSPERNATLCELETPSRRLAEIESMTVDFQGNLHLLWIDRGDDLTGPRAIRASARSFHYARFSGTTRPSEETQEDFYLSMIAAVVLDNGQVYVVSREGIVEAARPVSPNNPAPPLLTLLVFSSVLAGLDTEVGTYLVIRWRGAVARSRKSSARRRSSSVDMKLVQKIARRPGLTLSDLKSAARSTVFDVAARLSDLEASGILRSVREGTRQRFYCLAPNYCVKSRSVELRDSILRLVEDEPGINEAAIARRLVLSQQLANYHLRLLTEARVLSGIRTEGRVSYYVNKWCRRSTLPRDSPTRLWHFGIQYSRSVSY